VDSIREKSQALRKECAEMRRQLSRIMENSRRQCQASKAIRAGLIRPAGLPKSYTFVR
jgi:hypothetical protein